MSKTDNMQTPLLKETAENFENFVKILSSVYKRMLKDKKILIKIKKLGKHKSPIAQKLYSDMTGNLSEKRPDIKELHKLLNDKKTYRLLLLKDKNGDPLTEIGN